MARGKKKGGRRGDDTDSEDEKPPLVTQGKNKAAPAAAAPNESQKPSRKEKRQQKQQQKKQSQHDDSDNSDDDNLAALLGGKMKNKYDSGDDDSDAGPPKGRGGRPATNAGAKKKKGKAHDSSEDEKHPKAQVAIPAAKSKKGGRARDSDDSEEEEVGHKGKRGGRAAAVTTSKKSHVKFQLSDDDDDDSESDDQFPTQKGGGARGKAASKKSKGKAGSKDDSDDDSEPKNKPNKGKDDKKKKHTTARALQESDDEDEHDDDDDMEQENDSEVEQVTFKLADDWGESSKKKKKEKKEKKEKKHKKEKKKKKDSDDEDAEKKKKKKDKKKESKGSSDSDIEQDVEKVSRSLSDLKVEADAPQKEEKAPEKVEPKKAEPKQKSKFELQMEAALKKKGEEKKEEPEKKVETKTKKKEELKQPEPEPEWVDTNLPAQTEEEHEIMYGAPDDVAWTDKSHAQRDAENAQDEAEEDLTHGPDGKKLSNKERKKLQKAREAAKREAEYEASAAKASKEGAQFACSQTAVNENDPQWQNSLDITIPSFTISAAGKILFKDAAFNISHGRRYGLVGPNGRGKSTLLKMIASRDLKLPPRVDFLYVEQEVVADDTPAVEAVLRADSRRWDLLEEEKKLMKALDDGDESEQTLNRLQEVVDELTNMGADAAESKARRILYGLGFSMEMQTKPTKMFSGGWRMRISLARALFVEPTLLMLDEPTNHLDLNAVIWLDEYLQRWKKTLLVVSHDQDFLNSVCQEVLHIEDLKLVSYKGNYDSFKKAEKTKFEQQVKAWEKQEKRLRELKRSGQSRAKAQETVMKGNAKRESGARAQKKKGQAVASGSEAAEQAELIKRPREYAVKLEFAEVAELSRPVMEVNNVHFRYSSKHPVIFNCVDFGIDMDSRVCIVGPNGAGKSTLLKLLTGELQPTTGEVKRNPRLRMGIYNQHFVDRLPMNKSPVEHLRDRFPDEDYQSVRNRLGKYGLEGHAHEVTMRDLSGGQKARVVFVELSLQKPHILLLDEPTNNLDIETIDALCDAINHFNGGIVVVTHDQRLIEECDCKLWVVEKQGVTEWVEGFDDYKANILRELEEEIERENQVRKEKLDAAAAARAEKLARLASKVKKK